MRSASGDAEASAPVGIARVHAPRATNRIRKPRGKADAHSAANRKFATPGTRLDGPCGQPEPSSRQQWPKALGAFVATLWKLADVAERVSRFILEFRPCATSLPVEPIDNCGIVGCGPPREEA